MYLHYRADQTEMSDAVLRAMSGDRPRPPRDAWKVLAELGLGLLAVPEDAGGLQATATTSHAVAEALGRRLQAAPLAVSAIGATRLIDRLAAEPLRSEWLDAMGTGERVVALAVGEPQTDADLGSIRTRAVPVDGGWRLQGRKTIVVQGGDAHGWIVSARLPDGGTGLFLLDESVPGLSVRPYACLDETLACDLLMEDAVVDIVRQLLPDGRDTQQALESAVDMVNLLLCAESIGIQARLLDDTVAYARQRQQFGRPLGAFQAVQHRLADMLVQLEQARSLAWWAATHFDQAEPAEASWMVSAAKVRCVVSGRFIGLQAIHLHGGMGMTDELPVGAGVKRLLAIESSFGGERWHLTRVAEHHGAQRTAAAGPDTARQREPAIHSLIS